MNINFNAIYVLIGVTIIFSSSTPQKEAIEAGGKYKSTAIFLKIVSYLRETAEYVHSLKRLTANIRLS